MKGISLFSFKNLERIMRRADKRVFAGTFPKVLWQTCITGMSRENRQERNPPLGAFYPDFHIGITPEDTA